MSVTLTDIETLVRELVDDCLRTDGHDIYSYNNSTYFTISEENPVSVTSVTLNDAPTDYVYSSGTHVVQLNASSGSYILDDSIDIYFTYYNSWSSTEIANYIKAALTQLSIRNYKIFSSISSTIYPEPAYRERCLIAAVAAALMKPGNESYRFPDLSIQVPKSLSTPELIDKILATFKRNSVGIVTLI